MDISGVSRKETSMPIMALLPTTVQLQIALKAIQLSSNARVSACALQNMSEDRVTHEEASIEQARRVDHVRQSTL